MHDDNFLLNLQWLNANIVNNIPNTKIDKSTIHGYGLFASKSFAKGHIIGFLDGQVIEWKVFKQIEKSFKNTLSLNTFSYFFMEWNFLTEDTLLIRPFRTKYSYINHSNTPNVALMYNPIRIVAIHSINEGNELTIDYTKEPMNPNYFNDKEKAFLWHA